MQRRGAVSSGGYPLLSFLSDVKWSLTERSSDVAERFYYDAGWRLVEIRIDDAHDDTMAAASLTPGWPDMGDLSSAPFAWRVMQQHVWDPIAIDRLVQRRVAVTADPGVDPPLSISERWWAFTERSSDVMGEVPELSGRLRPEFREHFRYSAYGVPSLDPAADFDQDGSVDLSDLSLFGSRIGKTSSDPEYVHRMDRDLDGTIDAVADHQGFTGEFGLEEYKGSYSTRGLIVGYAGAIWDPAVELWLMRHRWLDPHSGRWLTRDPAGYVDGMSLYGYVGQGVWGYRDPMGLTGTPLYHWTAPTNVPSIIDGPGYLPGDTYGNYIFFETRANDTPPGGVNNSSNARLTTTVDDLSYSHTVTKSEFRAFGREAERQLIDSLGAKNWDSLSITERQSRIDAIRYRNIAEKMASEGHSTVRINHGKGRGSFAMIDADELRAKSAAGQCRITQIRGAGAPAAAKALEEALGESTEKAAKEAAKKLGPGAKALRLGGKVVIVVGVAADAYAIYTAEDKYREVAATAGGFLGAVGATAASGAVIGSVFPGAGTVTGFAVGLGSGVVGYFVGRKATEVVYDAVNGVAPGSPTSNGTGYQEPAAPLRPLYQPGAPLFHPADDHNPFTERSDQSQPQFPY